MKLLDMAQCHISQVAALECQCFPDPWMQESFADELQNPLSLWLVATEGEQVVGYVGSQTVLDSSDMMNLAVSPEYRRQGIAKALVTALVERLLQRGSRALLLEVRASNDAAISLYEKLGFFPVGRRPNYYLRPREDALILRKELI